MAGQLVRLEKIFDYSPDLAAVLNLPNFQIPSRIYISNEFLEEVYENVVKASQNVAERIEKIPRNNIEFIIGFVYGMVPGIGEDGKDRDFFMFPYEKSRQGNLVKALPIHIKNNIQRTGKSTFKGDFGIILGDEEAHRRTSPSLEEYMRTLPELRLNRYVK